MADQPMTLRPLTRHGLATVMARKGIAGDAIAAVLGMEAPSGPCIEAYGARTLIGTGPGVWLLKDEVAGPDWAAEVARALAGLASISDQSSGYALFELAGPCARSVLQSGLAIDMHPQAFPQGHAATSVIAHIGVILWCVGPDIFHLATFRSYATDFRHWLDHASQHIA